MGNKVNSALGLSYGKSSSSETGETNTIQSGTTQALWDSNAQDLINSLSSGARGYQNAANAGSAALQQILSGSNPYVDAYIRQSNQQADSDYTKALGQTRTAGFRGGQGSDFINQANLAANYANQKGLWNAETRLNAYNQNNQDRLNAANAAANQQAQTLALLQLLRGETTQAQSDTKYSKKGSGSSTAVSSSIGAS